MGQHGKHFWPPEEELITNQYASEWDATDVGMAQCVGCLFDMAARVGGGGGATNRARRRRQSHKNLQKLKRKWFPNREPKLVPKIGTTTRTLAHCYLKTNYAREEHQNMSPKLEPFSVPKTGTHYNPMRDRVRPKRYPSLIPSLQPHAQPSETQTTQMQVPKTVICC